MAKELLIGSLVVGIVILSIFLFVSIQSLEFNNIGLNYSSYFKSIENKTYHSGIHFLGLGHEFIAYPLNIKTVDFSSEAHADLPGIDCRTWDGLELKLEISFQYRPMKNKIYDIYMTFGDKLSTIVRRMAIDSISDTATEFKAYEIFSKRKEISEKMFSELAKKLSTYTFVELVFF